MAGSKRASRKPWAYISIQIVHTHQAQNICVTFVRSWTKVEDVLQMLYKCFVFAWHVNCTYLELCGLRSQNTNTSEFFFITWRLIQVNC